jgi:hypothetical protein
LPGPVHAWRWRVDKLVHNVVEKPLTGTSPRPYDLGTVRTRDNEEGSGRDHQ